MKYSVGYMWPVFLLLISAGLVFAQNEEEQRLVLFQSEKPFPAKISEYEAAQKAANEFARKYGFNLTVSVFESDNGTFYFLSDIQNYAALDRLRNLRNEVGVKADKAELKKTLGAFRGIVDYNTSDVYSPGKYSYAPKEAEKKSMSMKFNRWTFFNLYPYYDESGLREALREMMNFCEENNVEIAYDIYYKAFGGENNRLVIVEGADSQADYYHANAEFNKKFGKQVRPLWEKFLTFVKNYHGMDCWYRPDLSLIDERSRDSAK